MPRRDREINIFNIAFLDVITGAMGAFILLVLLLAPYYTGPQTPPPQMKAAQRAINKAADETRQIERQLKNTKNGVSPKLLEKLKTLLHKLRMELAAAQRRMIRLRSQVNHLESQNHKLKQENSRLRAELTADQRLIQKLKEDIAQLQAQIRQLQAKIQKQRQTIKFLEEHQGASAYRALDVLVERTHTPNGRFDAGAPFIVACRTNWQAGVTENIGKQSVALVNDPAFNPMSLLHLDHFGEMIQNGAIPFPHNKDVHLWPVQLDNGPGVAKRSPNAMMLQVQEANLRSEIDVYVVLLTPSVAGGGLGKLNTNARFLLTAAYGKSVVHKSFKLDYRRPIKKFVFTPLPKKRMTFIGGTVENVLNLIPYSQALANHGVVP
jgi:hypothetical protein